VYAPYHNWQSMHEMHKHYSLLIHNYYFYDFGVSVICSWIPFGVVFINVWELLQVHQRTSIYGEAKMQS